MSTTSEKLDRIIELLEERLPKQGICGDELTTVWSDPMNSERWETHRVCALTAGHGGLHRDEDGNTQWPNVAVRDPEDDLDSLILSAHPEVRRHVEAVQKSVRVLTRKCAKAEADVERLTRERDEQRDRYEALRADVQETHRLAVAHHLFTAGPTHVPSSQAHEDCAEQARDSLAGILARDDERGRQ